ncbi:MAG: mechanosensitive ion channel family protein [Flavobacteriaceae bacterium]|nr:mechanosensitive ion channel family protein [Flavobacteriaceae bacterium]
MKKTLFILLFVSTFSFSQKGVQVDLSNPNATIYTHLYFLQTDSYDASKAAMTIYGLPKEEAIEKSIKIKEVLDGKGLIVDFGVITKSSNYLDTIYNAHNDLVKYVSRFVPFPNQVPEIYVEKIGNSWYYSKETVANIDRIYSKTFLSQFTWLQKKFPNFFKKVVYGIRIWKPIGALLLLLFSALLFYILNPIIFFVLKKVQKLIYRKTFIELFDLLHELARPIVFIIIIRVIKNILPSLQLFKVNSLLMLGLSIAETIFWVFVFFKLAKLVLSIYTDYTKKTHSKLDEQLAPILTKIVSVFILLIGLLHILTLFGVNPTAVIAGASIGGIAIAFAAQDSVKNLIGTIVIFLDKPFHIGDWIKIGSVEGTVENVGLRSTRVRAADTSIFQIPNSKVTEVEINNMGLRLYRRYNTKLGIRYDTPPELIEAFVKGIRALIIAHPETRSESYNVEFTGFGDSALLIMVNVYFKKLDWGSEQSSKHRLHIAIVKLAMALNVEFAFPSSTLMIEQFPDKNPIMMKYNTDTNHINQSIQSIVNEFKNTDYQQDTNVSSHADSD